MHFPTPVIVRDTDQACPASAECPESSLLVQECHPDLACRESRWVVYPAYPPCSKFRDRLAYQAGEAPWDGEESAARPPDVRLMASPRHPLPFGRPPPTSFLQIAHYSDSDE